MSQNEPTQNNTMHLALYATGGLCLGAGLLNLYYSFGWDPTGAGVRQPMNTNIAGVGFSALDNIGLMPAADYALPLVVLGICCLVIANATAWKETGGY